MKKLFWVLFVLLFLAIIVYTAAPKSLVSLDINFTLTLVISAFTWVGILLGAISAKSYHRGMPRTKLPDKGEFLLRFVHELKDRVVLCLVNTETEQELFYEVKREQLLTKDGDGFVSFENFPRKFIVTRRYVAKDDGPVRAMYYIIPM